jgi:hypothetical protein
MGCRCAGHLQLGIPIRPRQTIVASVQPAIVEQFNSVDRLSWVSVAFLGAGGTNLIWGKVFSRFNIKYANRGDLADYHWSWVCTFQQHVIG